MKTKLKKEDRNLLMALFFLMIYDVMSYVLLQVLTWYFPGTDWLFNINLTYMFIMVFVNVFVIWFLYRLFKREV